MEKRERQSNIELMRIVCMLLIVAHHFVAHGTGYASESAWNSQILKILGGGARISINCFLFITGYFGIDVRQSCSKKLIRLWIDREFYAVMISIIMLMAGMQAFSAAYFFHAVLPVLTCRHNYVTTFFYLYLLIPFLNRMLQGLNKKEYGGFCLTYGVLISLIPTVMGLTVVYRENVYSYLGWMVFLYCIGGYIRLYGTELNWKYPFLICGGILAMTFFCVFLAEEQVSWIPERYFLNNQYSIIALLLSVMIFKSFLQLNIRKNSIINWMAAASFGVLLIHDDPLVREVLWNKMFHCNTYTDSPYLFPIAMAVIGMVYGGCVLTDKIYVYFIKRPVWRTAQRIKMWKAGDR